MKTIKKNSEATASSPAAAFKAPRGPKYHYPVDVRIIRPSQSVNFIDPK